MTYAGATESLGYDNDGLLATSGSFIITRNIQNGLPETVSDGTMTNTRTFSSYGELDEYGYKINGNDIYTLGVTRDLTGKITQKVENIEGTAITWDYSYDGVGRLIEAKKDGVVVESYAYDANGNKISETNALRGIVNRSHTYSDEDHLLTAGADTYQFDVDGFLTNRITSEGTMTFNYSSRGELLSATLPNSTVISYDHDPMGRRIVKKVNGAAVEKYLWQGKIRLLAVYDGSDNLLMRFDYADGRMPISMTKDAVTYYLSYDQVGSLRAVVDTLGTVVKRVDYDSFGNIINDSNPSFTVPFGFAGGLHDRDTGLVRFGARDYDPAIGRWTAKDPIDFSGGINLYAYVGNNPVNWIDPWGLFKYSPTAGDPVDDTTKTATECFETCSGLEITVTAGKEGGHSKGSAHETGQACDIGKNSNPNLTRDTAEKCFKQCFDKKSSYGQEEGNHYHFQTRPGQGGATGFPNGVK